MAEDERFHLPVEFLAVGFVIFAIHSSVVPADAIYYLNQWLLRRQAGIESRRRIVARTNPAGSAPAGCKVYFQG
jgi:hypothetical protein